MKRERADGGGRLDARGCCAAATCPRGWHPRGVCRRAAREGTSPFYSNDNFEFATRLVGKVWGCGADGATHNRAHPGTHQWQGGTWRAYESPLLVPQAGRPRWRAHAHPHTRPSHPTTGASFGHLQPVRNAQMCAVHHLLRLSFHFNKHAPVARNQKAALTNAAPPAHHAFSGCPSPEFLV